MRGDTRGVSITVSHTLTFAITSILITGLMLSAGTLLHDQKKEAARRQLTDIGGKMAREVMAVDDLDGPGRRVNATVSTNYPATVASESYTVTLTTDASGQPQLVLEAPTLELVVSVPLDLDTSIRASSTNPGTMRIYNCWWDQTDPGSPSPSQQKLSLEGGIC